MSAKSTPKTRPYSDSKGDLIRALTFASEQVYNQGGQDEIAHLDRELRAARWYLFDRIRFHLYAKNPQRAEDWIREAILRYERYGEDTYGFEFQQIGPHCG